MCWISSSLLKIFILWGRGRWGAGWQRPHHSVQCLVGLPSNQEVNRTRERWNLRRADYDNFRRDLLELPLPVVGPAEDMWAAFRTQFQEIQERHNRLYQEAKRHPTSEAERQVTIQRKVVKKMIRQAMVAEEHQVAFSCKDNPKEFFGYVTKERARAPLCPVLSDNGQPPRSTPITEYKSTWFSSW